MIWTRRGTGCRERRSPLVALRKCTLQRILSCCIRVRERATVSSRASLAQGRITRKQRVSSQKLRPLARSRMSSTPEHPSTGELKFRAIVGARGQSFSVSSRRWRVVHLTLRRNARQGLSSKTATSKLASPQTTTSTRTTCGVGPQPVELWLSAPTMLLGEELWLRQEITCLHCNPMRQV